MPDPDRYKISVRATRAYLAGFGTSGSLLAGAALLFLLGSAIVAFRGWPQINTGPATSNVSAAPLASTSAATRRLSVVLAAHRHAAVARSAKGAVAAGVRSRHITRQPTATPKGGVGTGSGAGSATSGSPSSTATGTGAGSTGATPAQCSNCSTPKATAPVTTVVKTVSNVGTAVGQQITGLTGAVGNQVSSASPQVGSTITTTGSAVGNTVTTTTNTATNVITTATNALGLGGGH